MTTATVRGPRLAQVVRSGKAYQEKPRTSSAPIREDLVARVRAEIQAGIYDSADKMEIALDRLLAKLMD